MVFKAAPLPAGFMVARIVGFLVSVMYFYKFIGISLAIAFAIVFACMFIASIIAMRTGMSRSQLMARPKKR